MALLFDNTYDRGSLKLTKTTAYVNSTLFTYRVGYMQILQTMLLKRPKINASNYC